MPLGPAAPMPAAVIIHCCERTVMALSVWAGGAQAACEPKIGHPPLIRKGSLIAAINPTVAPIQYVNEDGDIIGLDPDLGNAIADRLCLKMVFESVQFATMIPGLQDGRFDLINSFMFYTPERASQVIMVPYGASTLAIVVGGIVLFPSLALLFQAVYVFPEARCLVEHSGPGFVRFLLDALDLRPTLV